MTYESNSDGQANNQGQENRQCRNIDYWFPIGVGMGVALGAAFDNLALGIAIGAAVGIAMNQSRIGVAKWNAGTPDGRLIAVIAIGSLVILAGGVTIFFFLMR